MSRLSLPTVTLCAATSVNVRATVEALHACLDQIDFARAVLLTDSAPADVGSDVEVVPIDRLRSARDYSHFLLHRLVDHVRTSHCLVVQWDGFVLDAGQWDPAFLEFDYIGAPWPQFRDGHDVGNGGFSLRSRRLLESCRDPAFEDGHPEDVAICRTNRRLLEARHGIRFADSSTAQRFSFERSPAAGRTFGFHGVFNMIPALGPDRFWEIYRSLDDRSTVVDYRLLGRQIGTKPHAWRRRIIMAANRLRPRAKR